MEPFTGCKGKTGNFLQRISELLQPFKQQIQLYICTGSIAESDFIFHLILKELERKAESICQHSA
jgi:hypothetical protein